MAKLIVRFRFNPGRVGSPLGKLGELTKQTDKFLRSLTSDLGIVAKKDEWLARKFTNDSVAFDGEYADEVTEAVETQAFNALEAITGSHPFEASNRGLVSLKTMAEFSQIGRILDPDEKFLVGLYREPNDEPTDWHEVTYRQTAEIRLLLDQPIPTYGSVQGIIHAWHSGTQPPFFQLRELASGFLIRCVYAPDIHPQIHQATHSINTVVHVYGDIRWDRITNSIIDMAVSGIEVTETLSNADFNLIFGSIPDFTGSQDTAEYIEEMRENGS